MHSNARAVFSPSLPKATLKTRVVREQKTRFLLLRLPKNQRNSTRPSRAPRVFTKEEERKSREKKTPQKVLGVPEKGRHAGSERERCCERDVTTPPRAPSSSTFKSQKPRAMSSRRRSGAVLRSVTKASCRRTQKEREKARSKP